MQTPPSLSPPAVPEAPAASSPAASRRGLRRPLGIAFSIVAALALVAAATAGGYALGHLRAARQPAPGTVAAGFVQFRLASGWYVAAKTSSEVELRRDPNGYMDVRSGNARQAGLTSDADLLQDALYGVTQNHLRGSVGSCLPLTRVDVGGRSGEEVGFLFRQVGVDGTSAAQNCEFVWADVEGSKFYSWTSTQPVSRLSELVKATQQMQRTATWGQ